MSTKTYPTLPGVYIFKDANDTILYIGKAKNLQNRIKSYFSGQDTRPTILHLMTLNPHVETIITANETEALHLEAHLIGQHKPKYNQLLKQGDPFVYIHITQPEKKLPELTITRKKDQKGWYFGPFLQRREARSVAQYIIRTFSLQLCSKKIPEGCLAYHIGKCAGSCKADFDVQYYITKLRVVKELLESNVSDALKILQHEINQANIQLNFERAKHLYYYQKNLQSIHKTATALKKSKYTNVINTQNNLPSNLSLLSKLKKRLNLTKIPYTIDCFDISHMQSKAIVGSCIRFTDGRPDKKAFRRFQIKTLTQQNDYAALHEIVSRRYRYKKNLPDLIIIDGGKGQITATRHLVGDTPLVGLAKREETIISADLQSQITLDVHKEEDRLLLEIRDYAHHFAISYHRKKRSVFN